jgi:hypothetical protein
MLMKYKYVSFVILIASTALLFSSCHAIRYPQRDPFYNDGSERDHLRFPLIKPYYAIWISDKLGWEISLHISPLDKDMYYYLSLSDVRKIAVENDVIMVYSAYEEPVDESVGQKVLYWFVIVPDQSIETGFETEIEFNEFIQQFNIERLEWRTPDDILAEYDQTSCLDWIPGCN